MRRVSIAASSQLSADAGAELAFAGGNAVDAAVGAMMVSLTTEPGIVAPGSSGFITIWPAGADPVVIDAYAEMPGRGVPRDEFGHAGRKISISYGGGMETIVGYGSIATPGGIAGLGKAIDGYGDLGWADVLEPAARWTEQGFPLPKVSDEYLSYAAEAIFGWHPESRRALHEGARRLAAGDPVVIPDLAHAIRQLAAEGADCFYTGDLGRAIAAEIRGNGGLLTAEDLAAYEALVRTPILLDVDDWQVALNPSPAVGGAAVAAVLLLLESDRFSGWGPLEVRRMVEAQHAVFDYRRNRLEGSDDIDGAVAELLADAAAGDHRALLSSPSTVHCSAVDTDGTACAITMSAGYGSGAMIAGTGMWMNNSLGEIELLPGGFHALKPGTRMFSNMAPTVARRRDGAVLAAGSPGADRITTAMAQFLVNFLHLGMSLTEAVDHPRVHVELVDGGAQIAHEPGVDVSACAPYLTRSFPDLSMFFGGVQASVFMPGAGMFEAADSRRTGAVARGGGD